MAGGRLAVIGLGNMGAGMALRLLDRGFELSVHNRTAEKAAPVVAAGAKPATSPEEAVRDHDIVLLSLADEPAVEQVLFGAIVPALAPGSTVIDTSTVSPAFARDIAARLREHGLRRVEATVVGNPHQARNGELRVFTAGEAEPAPPVADILAALGPEPRHVGPAGAASALKLVFNLVLGAQLAGLAEAVAYGTGQGLDRNLLLGAVGGSGFSSPVLRFRAEIALARKYEPAQFRAGLMEKDLRIALDGGDRLAVLESVRRRFAEVVAAGDGTKDAAVLIDHLA